MENISKDYYYTFYPSRQKTIKAYTKVHLVCSEYECQMG